MWRSDKMEICKHFPHGEKGNFPLENICGKKNILWVFGTIFIRYGMDNVVIISSKIQMFFIHKMLQFAALFISLVFVSIKSVARRNYFIFLNPIFTYKR